MAEFIQSVPSMSDTTLPTTAGSMIRGDQWGVSNTLSGWIVQSETITRELITDTTQDQKGAVVSQLDYDEHFTCELNLIGGTGGAGDGTEDPALPQIGDITFQYAEHTWKVTNVQYTGSYESKKAYSVSLERWHHFPTQLSA